MSRFRYRFEKILKVRTHDKRRAAASWAQAQQAVAEAHQEVESMHRSRAAHAADSEIRRAQGMTVRQWRAEGEQQAALVEMERRAVEVLQQRLAVAAEARRVFEVARMKERSFEQLQEQHYERYQAEALRSEQMELDELAEQMRRAAHSRG